MRWPQSHTVRTAHGTPQEPGQAPPPRSTGGERGFALAVAIFALVIIAALITGVFFAARQEMKMGQNSMTAQRAFHAADAGINKAIAEWDIPVWNSLAINAETTFGGTLPGGSGSWSGRVKRLNNELFFVRVTGTDNRAMSTRTIGALSRIRPVNVNVRGAVTTQGEMTVGGHSKVVGVNTNPSGWTCPGVTDTMPAIATSDASKISYNGSAYTVTGPVVTDTSINASTFTQFGDMTFNDLVAVATLTLPQVTTSMNIAPVVTGTTCNRAVTTNWGDPLNPAGPCGGYFPIIHVQTSVQVNGGYGQGILLVEGDVKIDGGFQFYGPVISKGTFTTQGTGGHITGGVMAANLDFASDVIMGNAEVMYSSCAVSKALQANSPGRWLRQRSWVDLF